MSVLFRPCGDILVGPAPRGQADIDLMALISAQLGQPVTIDDEVDYEDWMEPAAMLGAALRAELAVTILSDLPLARAIANPAHVIPGHACRDFLIGRLRNTDTMGLVDSMMDLGWPGPGGDRVNHYAELESFSRNAGRQTRLADMPGEASPDLVGPGSKLGDGLLAFAGSDCLVKQVWPAKSMPLVTLHPAVGMTADEAEGLFFNEVGFHIMRFEGDRNSLLVQERVTMTHETRFFVIDGALVTGAACIEANTPQQNPGMLMGSQFEVVRNSGELVTSEAIADQLWSFADRMVREIAEEAPALRHYVIDLALGADGNPLVIELNPAFQAGLYGINADALFSAIHDAAQAAPSRRRAAEIVEEPEEAFEDAPSP